MGKPVTIRQFVCAPAFCVGVIAVFLLAPATVLAQDDTAAAGEPVLEEVIVTGTRIKRRNFSSASPITSIEQEAFEFSGQPTLEEYLNQLPQLQPDYGRTSNNPGDGTATLNLRGLGPDRTLVLLNGRRLAPSGIGSAVDANNLPRSIMQRVEIITGGASTVYGSDAIAGVINFITRDDFTGLSFDTSYYVTAKGDADIYDFNFAWGHNRAGGRGNVTLYGGYYERKPLFAGERDFTAISWLDDWVSGQLQPGGSSATPGGVVFFPLADLGDGPSRITWNPDGTPRPFNFWTDAYNYAPVNYLQTPLTRSNAGVMATLSLANGFEAYIEAAFTRNESRQNLASVPAFEFLMVNVDNPVLTPETRTLFELQMLAAPGLAAILYRRRMTEMGPRIIESIRDYTRVVSGMRGDFSDGWYLDAWVTYTNADETVLFLNDVSRSRLSQGMLVDPATGQCYDPSGGCVALDIFGEGRLSPEGADFIRFQPLENIVNRKQYLASAVVTGAPFQTWAGPLDMSFGVEWRRDEGYFKADDALFGGDNMGFGGSSPVTGTESVYEIFSEALIPLSAADGNGHYLGLELGARYSNYRNAGAADTWKAGIEWQPNESLRLRAMLQHSVRAPNNAELFEALRLDEDFLFFDTGGTDPCSAEADPVASGFVEKCILQGLAPDQVGVFVAQPFYPVTFITGGNPDLVPEAANTATIGFIWTPVSIAGLSMAVDYFDLEVSDTIGDISPLEICFDEINSNHSFCDDLRRDVTGNIAEVFAPINNRGKMGVSGFDAQVEYRFDLPIYLAISGAQAELATAVTWTHLFSSETQESVASEILDCAGYFGWPCEAWQGGGSFPDDRVSGHFTYTSGSLDINLAWRWIDGMRNAAAFGSAVFGVPNPVLAVEAIPSQSYFDLGLSYRFNDSLLARFGINNVFDRQPPQMGDAVWSNNTDTGFFDIFGRAYFLSISFEK